MNSFDRSGIESAAFLFPRSCFEVTRQDLPIVTDPGNGNKSYDWTFAETGALRTSAGLTFSIRVNDTVSALPFANIGFAGNETLPRPLPIVFVVTQERACAL